MKIGLKKVIVGLLVVCFMFFFMQQPASASPGSFIIINKSNNQLAYFENNKLTKVFKVATGKQPSYTPEGQFKIVNKIVNRPYYTGKIPGGDPRNPLGNRWLGLNARGTWGTTYAIHGNNNARSIGQYVSAGCIRLYNDEVQWLFSKVPVNTPVIITTSGKSFTALASANGFNVESIAVVPVSTSILKKGSRGAEVKNLQQRLTELGYSTKGIDGIFGKNTDTAVRKFQKAKKLKVDGIVGPATKKALGKM
ncbi:L,D-transpeptidase family protein [Bacillus sp. Marseille-Q3570]|uniref:L,D-transpeptidase family protein n=1 Tax=Bacillus sp. Marseille-Q3570 TaxID=2963522 RepID=UPI0021B70CDB|nr:L,D-transpeptidase family protein [Bacillus sp. Marseille-Q3570]